MFLLPISRKMSGFFQNSHLRVLNFDSAGLVQLGPLDQRVVDEGLEDAHQALAVGPQNRQRDLAHPDEDALVAGHAQAVDHVLRAEEEFISQRDGVSARFPSTFPFKTSAVCARRGRFSSSVR